MSVQLVNSPAKLRASISCQLAEVRPLARTVRDFLVEQQASEEEICACELALVEACNNAVLYATEDGQNFPIEVEVTCDQSQIQLRIDDHTDGFELPET